MLSPKSEEFLTSIISYVKFPLDRRAIKYELECHLLDIMDAYLEQEYGEEAAEELAITAMGDFEEIGRQLNREHNPFLGWLWKVSQVAVVLFILLNLFFIGVPLVITVGNTLLKSNPAASIPQSDIVYNIEVKQKVRLDDTVIDFTNVIVEKNGNLDIFYRYYDTKLWGMGWGLGTIGDITDDLGHKYQAGSGFQSGGIVSTGRRTIKNFSKEAKTLIIIYDQYNRQYRVEIPLRKVCENEY